MADPITPVDRAALITMTEDDATLLRLTANNPNAAFCLGMRKKLADALAELDAQRRARFDELVALRAALEWLVQLSNGVGKAGGSPAFGEWEDAVEAAIAALTPHSDRSEP